MKAIRLGLVVSIVTTLLAGLYFVVYIYRWEMHRALIAGVVFLAGEIALATSLVLRRIDVLRPVERAPEPSPAPEPRGAVDVRGETASTGAPASAPAPPPAPDGTKPAQPMPWLGADRFGVFVPILLGAGTIVSGIGWVVEHLARMTTDSSKPSGRFERSLAALAMPTAPLVGPVPVIHVRTKRPAAPRLGALGRMAVVLLVGSLAVVLLTLALLGRTRPDPPVPGTRSVVTMEVLTRNGIDVDLAARSLWEACHIWIPRHDLVDMRTTSPGHFVLTIDPSLSEQAERRLMGCLNDGTLEQVHAELGSHTRVEVPG